MNGFPMARYAAFRFRKYCQHLDLICQLCSEEREPATSFAE